MAAQSAAAVYHHLQHQQQQQQHQQLLLPRAQGADANGVERRGSAESAYYSTYSGGDRRASWQEGDVCAAAAAAAAEAEVRCRRAASGSVLCDACETRRFQPAERSPFHTRSHAEVVMEEFARLTGDPATAAGAAAAAAAASAASAGFSRPVAPSASEHLRQHHHQHHQQPQQPQPPPTTTAQAPYASQHTIVDTLPPLMEEIPESAGDEADGRIGMVGRLNTISSCDFRFRRRHQREAAAAAAATANTAAASSSPPTSPTSPTSAVSAPAKAAAATAAAAAATDLPTPASKRKFSLDARTMTTPSLSGRPAQLRLKPAAGLVAAASSGRRLFRLFHQEVSQEELASFNEKRRSSKSGAAAAAAAATSPQPEDQNPSQLFRRFQSTDDDYFVALKVEDPHEEVFPVVQERQQLISVSDDGRTTVVTELATPTSDATDTTDAATADTSESEIEIALRLAKTSPFAYVPPPRLQPAASASAPAYDSLGRRTSAASTMSAASTSERRLSTTQQPQGRRDTDWRHCLAEMSSGQQLQQRQQLHHQQQQQAGGAGSSTNQGEPGGSKVKRLLARFSGSLDS